MPSLKGPIIGILVAGLFTFAGYSAAVDAEHGIATQASGRRAWLKQLLADTSSALGSTGVLVVGGAITAGFVVWLVLTIRARQRYATSAGRHDGVR